VLDWGTTVWDAFPEWRSTMDGRFKQVTVEHLMAHRSGIVDVRDDASAALRDMSRSVMERRKEFTRLMIHRTHGGMLGTTYSYQNANFIIVGAMLERYTGKSWEELMQKELFGPLGMTSAGFGAPGSGDLVDQPWGHSDRSGSRVPNRGDNPAALGPAG